MECVLRWLDDLDSGLLALRFAAVRGRALSVMLLLSLSTGMALLLF